MTDITERLRDHERSEWAICNEAAGEIERLRAECTDTELRAGIALQLREIERVRAQLSGRIEDIRIQEETIVAVRKERDELRAEVATMRTAWESLADAAIEFAEHLKPEMSPQDAAMVGKLREAFDDARRGSA